MRRVLVPVFPSLMLLRALVAHRPGGRVRAVRRLGLRDVGGLAAGACRRRAGAPAESPYFHVNSDDPGVDALPLKATQVDVRIAGVIAAVTVTQHYRNEGQRPIEARYVFPGSTRPRCTR